MELDEKETVTCGESVTWNSEKSNTRKEVDLGNFPTISSHIYTVAIIESNLGIRIQPRKVTPQLISLLIITYDKGVGMYSDSDTA